MQLKSATWVLLALLALYWALSFSTAYQEKCREIEHNRLVAAELVAIKDLAGISEATRRVIHNKIHDLETSDPEQSLLVATLLEQMRGAVEFVFVDVLNSRAFTLAALVGTLSAAAYLVHSFRAK